MSSKRGGESTWLPFADIMTGLMLVFLLLVIMLLSVVVEKDNQRKGELEQFKSVVDDLYNELDEAFADKRDIWGVRVSRDLTIHFENTNILFNRDSVVIKPRFEKILNEFIPKYLSILNKPKYIDRIKEIKIVGHTANFSAQYNTFIKTIGLSQARALEILKYSRDLKFFSNLSDRDRSKFEFLLSANGFGRGRAIDETGKYVYDTGNPIDALSRRVEFQVITDSDGLIKKLVKI